MNQLNEALERIKPYLADRISGDGMDTHNHYRADNDYGYFSGAHTVPVARLRLDWELSDEALLETKTREQLVDMMCQTMGFDLEDLIVNGDTMHVSDPLLKYMDGAKKRGKEVSDVDIFSAQLFWEYKDRKKTTEYTLFILMAVTFE